MKRALIVGAVACAMMMGCWKGDDESMAKKAGKAVGKTATDFATGVGTGVVKQLAVKAALTPDAAKLGLESTVARYEGQEKADGPKVVTVYIIANEKVDTTLMARALIAGKQEVGRSKVTVKMEKGDAKYISFPFEKEMETSPVEQYEIGVAK